MARYRVDGKASKWLVSYGVSLAEMSSILLRKKQALLSWHHFVSLALQSRAAC